MDFEVIDTVLGDTLGKGDIVQEDGEFHQLKSLDTDEDDCITFITANLSTGDVDDLLVDPAISYDIFRSY